MVRSAAEIGLGLDAMREALAEAIVSRHHQVHPELEARYGQRGRQKCREDASFHLSYLAQSLVAHEPKLFREYVAWAKVMLAGRGIAARELRDNLQITAEVLTDRLPAEDASTACRYIQAAIGELSNMPSTPPSGMPPDEPFSQLARSYLAALLACQRHVASQMILDAVRDGTSIQNVYMHVFQPSQQEIGRLWQINQITVAQEHYCSAVTQLIMSQLYPQIFAGPRIGRKFLAAGIGGDLHEIGIRMVADFFEMGQWDTVFLGTNVPSADLIRTIQDRKPDVVGISATITPHIGKVASVIAALRATPDCREVIILVGGHPFNVAPNLWKQIHADGAPRDAAGSVELANQLIAKRVTG